MRTNLDSDPRVFAVASSTKAHRQHVVGALHWLWSKADEHSTDGKIWGYTPEGIDDAVGIRDFSKALSELNRPWLVIGEGFVEIPRFSDHNGESAKQRALNAQRAAKCRLASSSPAKRACSAPVTVPALARAEAEQKTIDRNLHLQEGDLSVSSSALPATAENVLASFGVGEPMRSKLARLTNPTEVQEIAATIKPGRKNAAGVLIKELCKRHGIEPRAARSATAIGPDVERAIAEMNMLRRIRGGAGR